MVLTMFHHMYSMAGWSVQSVLQAIVQVWQPRHLFRSNTKASCRSTCCPTMTAPRFPLRLDLQFLPVGRKGLDASPLLIAALPHGEGDPVPAGPPLILMDRESTTLHRPRACCDCDARAGSSRRLVVPIPSAVTFFGRSQSARQNQALTGLPWVPMPIRGASGATGNSTAAASTNSLISAILLSAAPSSQARRKKMSRPLCRAPTRMLVTLP